MLPADLLLDEETLFKILRYGHSRIPVHEPNDPQVTSLAPVFLSEVLLAHNCNTQSLSPALYRPSGAYSSSKS